MLIVERTDPRDPQATALLNQSHALMLSLFPADGCHFLDIEKLTAVNIHFFTAREGEARLGTGALAVKEGYGEIKSMFTDPAGRGKGVAAAVLRTLEDTARELKLPLLRLETGTGLDAAHRLYERFGFDYRGPFGDYGPHPASIFMEKPL